LEGMFVDVDVDVDAKTELGLEGWRGMSKG
jgi:hypothetical protein